MKKIFLFIAILGFYLPLVAQDDELRNLEVNSTLYYSTKAFHRPQNIHKYLIDKKNTIVFTDTLTLPFVDDFSTNNLRSYRWIENNTTDTFYNVFGTCLGNEGITVVTETFMNDTSWYYTYDTLARRVDSSAKPPLSFTFFGPSPAACFAQNPQPFTYWPEYYTYTFDTTTGRVTDSIKVTPTDTIQFAPVIYFATAEAGKLWFDNYAYVNNTYPIDPPTIGVATLDGLNEFGLPYNNSSINTYGTADHLTSLPINLFGLEHQDSIYLSFYYQGQGLGDYPDKVDSLLVEFKDNSGAWRTMWSDTGYSSASFVPQKFKQVLINVPQLPVPFSFYHSTFQFRFRNKASLYGNNDHWHIDYVKLDVARSAADTITQDIAFQYPFPTILKNFTQMPADQFNNPADIRDTITLSVRNLDPNANNNPPATNYVKGASELYPTPVIVANNVLQTFNAAEYSYIDVFPSSEYTIPTSPNWPVDSLIISSVVSVNPNDSRPQNDTLKHLQQFSSVMAYDDGTAERSYGLSGLGVKKFAYEFNLHQPDTLAAFQIHFAQVDVNVSDLVFNFHIWDSLQIDSISFVDAPIYSLENKRPFYIDSLNGFATYKLDTPLIVSGKVYMGWAQTDDRRLQVGYDMNSTLGRPHMYIYSFSTWKPSSITPAGSPMIRLIFDTDFWGGTSSVIDLTNEQNRIDVFPNPAVALINIKSALSDAEFDVSLMNLMGQTVKTERSVQHQVDLTGLMNGIYLLTARDVRTEKVYHTKVIKISQ